MQASTLKATNVQAECLEGLTCAVSLSCHVSDIQVSSCEAGGEAHYSSPKFCFALGTVSIKRENLKQNLGPYALPRVPPAKSDGEACNNSDCKLMIHDLASPLYLLCRKVDVFF